MKQRMSRTLIMRRYAELKVKGVYPLDDIYADTDGHRAKREAWIEQRIGRMVLDFYRVREKTQERGKG